MSFLGEVLREAFTSLGEFGPEVREVLGLTLAVSGLATVLGVAAGVPLGAWLGMGRSRWRRVVLLLVNTGMGIPPVLAGLLLLLILWAEGPLGDLQMLFTPSAMVAVQTLLALPIAAGLTAAALRGLSSDATEQIAALALGPVSGARLALREAWPAVAGAVAASFGRVVSEVGAVLVVGGNIQGETRVLTTAIVQEARQARFGAAVALGMILLAIALVVNGAITWLQTRDAAHE